MNSSNNNLNFKNQNDNTDFELGSFNEEEEHNIFMNRKELVHIEDDTSINVDKSYDDDHSKSSTLKKGFMINNISAINEQFVPNNQLGQIGQKKFENELHDVSGDLNSSENGVESFPLMMAGRIMRNNNNHEEQIHMNMGGNDFDFNNENENEEDNGGNDNDGNEDDNENNGNNNVNGNNYNNIMEQIKAKTEYNNNFFTNQNGHFLQDLSSPKKKGGKNYLLNKEHIEIQDIEDEDEEEDIDENENNQHNQHNQNNEEEDEENNLNNNMNNNINDNINNNINNNITKNMNNNFSSIQMMLQNQFVPSSTPKSQTLNPANSIKNNNILNNNNIDSNNQYISAQKAINTTTPNINSNNNRPKNVNNNESMNLQSNKLFTISSFDHCYLGNNLAKFFGSVNTSGQTFGLAHSIDFQNKYNQLESKYNILFEQNKKLEAECEELKNSDRGVLDMLTYWQNFYLEILEIVFPKKSKNNDNSKNDYLDDPYRIQTINEVKKLVLISRDKAYSNFYKSQPVQIEIKNTKMNTQKEIKANNSINFGRENWGKKIVYSKGESFSVIETENKKNKKFLDEDDDLDFLPPIRHIEKINTGMNTDITGDNVSKPIVKEVIKEVTVVQQVPLQKFDYTKLSISKLIKDKTSIHLIGKPVNSLNQSPQSKIASKDVLIKAKPKATKINNKKESNNMITSKTFTGIKISQSMNINYKGLPPKTPKKFKKNILHKIAIVQTDMTAKNINSIETLNKACSSQLLNSQREKEKMQKLYDEKISSLNDHIAELDKKIKQLTIKNEKNNHNNIINNDKNNNNNNINNSSNNNSIKSNDNTIKSNEKITSTNNNSNNNSNINTESSPNNLNSSFIFLPEMIPPENTYKIFMHCVKHFKYEEEIYKKYLEEEDLFILKAFVSKMEKYLLGTSLPVLKENNKKSKKNEKNEKEIVINNTNYEYMKKDSIQDKIKENIIHDNKPVVSNIKTKTTTTTSDKKNRDYRCNSVYGNSNTFNKYKAAIMTLKNY